MKSGIFLFALSLCTAAHADGWPAFRGPGGDGHASAKDLPETWSEQENVVWKKPVPHKGWSTPLVWNDQVWVTTATEDGKDYFVLCFDRKSGDVLHEAKLFHSETPEKLGNDLNCYASPTGVIEDGRVYVHFGSYGTACIDTKSFAVLWQRTDLPCRHYRGPGSSLFDWKDTVILTMDGVDFQYLVALDKKTGATRWRADRSTVWDDIGADGKPEAEGDYRKAYSTPIVITVEGKPQLISTGSKNTVAYDPDTGRELWKTCYKGFSNASMPVWKDGLLVINTGYGKANLQAFRIDGKTSGDITSTMLWEQTKYVPARSSPVIAGDLLYMIADNGFISAVDLKDGEQLFAERTGGSASASPVFADGRLYFSNERGDTTVVQPGRTWQKLAVNSLETGILASPSIAGREIYLRTRTHLYRIEKK